VAKARSRVGSVLVCPMLALGTDAIISTPCEIFSLNAMKSSTTKSSGLVLLTVLHCTCLCLLLQIGVYKLVLLHWIFADTRKEI
jgi:hypothetical protein